MNKVYTQQPPLLHIEYDGYVNNNDQQISCRATITIMGINNKLTASNIARLHVSKEEVVAQIRLLGLEEMHIIELAHCDLSIDNVTFSLTMMELYFWATWSI